MNGRVVGDMTNKINVLLTDLGYKTFIKSGESNSIKTLKNDTNGKTLNIITLK